MDMLRNTRLGLHFTPAGRKEVDSVTQDHLQCETLHLQRPRVYCTISDHKKMARGSIN